MLDFGDELTLDGFRIPWLIWIQLLVFLLLLALLFCLSVIALDPSHHTTSPSASATATDSDLHTPPPHHHSTAVTNRLQSTRGVENTSTKGEIATSASTGIVREEFAEGEASTSSLYFLHPCYYFNLAKEAFLKCLGLDNDVPSTQNNRKTKES
ncbi:hypothetical protein glysoja_008443 [Glycine soja]|nr:hypothetical protein glysoja_008443 [Glycine soja]